MGSEWLERVSSSIPRGLSRYYVMNILKEKPHTGKEIIEEAIRQSGGIWKPSSSLVYPLLGRLLDEGLAEEIEGGRYRLTAKGVKTTEDAWRIEEAVKRQLDVFLRIGNAGRFVTADLLERLSLIASALGSNAKSMTGEELAKYKQFLNSELERLARLEADAEPEKDDGTEIKVE